MAIPLRDWLYLGAIVVLVAGFLGYRYSLIREGEARVRAANDRAVAAERERDARVSKETVDGLKSELDTLRRDSLQPIPEPPVRVCVDTRPRAPSIAPGTAAEPAPAWRLPSVSDGDRVRPDIGPELRKLAIAADILSARERACLAWARGIANGR